MTAVTTASILVHRVSHGFSLKPGDLVRRLHETCHDLPAPRRMRCFQVLPVCQSSGPGVNTVRRLANSVEKLEAYQVSTQDGLSPTTRASSADGQDLALLCRDMQKHLRETLQFFRCLTDEQRRVKSPPAQRHGTVSQEDALDALEALLSADLPLRLATLLPTLVFEARKDVMNAFSMLLWKSMPEAIDQQVLEYLVGHTELFQLLSKGVAQEGIGLHYGVILRSCARHKSLAEAMLENGVALELLQSVTHPNMDVSSEAFQSLEELLLQQKAPSAAWLNRNFRAFFGPFNALLLSGEYWVERQALSLLDKVLLDVNFKRVMLTYVSDVKHLQIHMNLLKDSSKAIQVEAFHVFKIFVANPRKTPNVQQILHKNRQRLVSLLESMLANRSEEHERQLCQDLRGVVKRLQALDAPPGREAAPPASASRGER